MLSTETPFYIKIENGIPVGNPMDVNSVRSIGYFENGYRNGELPSNFEPFEPVEEPAPDWNEYVVLADGKGDLSLNLVGDVWQKIYTVHKKNEAERRAAKINIMNEFFDKNPEKKSWIFSEVRGGMEPPVPCPPECKFQPSWNEAEQKWEGYPTPPVGVDIRNGQMLSPEEKAKIDSDALG